MVMSSVTIKPDKDISEDELSWIILLSKFQVSLILALQYCMTKNTLNDDGVTNFYLNILL